MRVYMRDKPTKWAIKLYQLSESKSGYVWQLEVMTKAPGISNSQKHVCLRLIDPLLKKGHTLYVDNYYCSPQLAEFLIPEDTSLVGTVRPNRKYLPQDLMQQQMTRGAMDYRRKGK